MYLNLLPGLKGILKILAIISEELNLHMLWHLKWKGAEVEAIFRNFW